MFGPFEVDKKSPVITGPAISPASPIFGQAVSATYECTDGGSGVVLCGPSGSSPITTTADTGSLNSPADSTVGTHTFTVTAKDQVGNVSPASSATYTVAQATPAITWANPPPIAYGTLLSGTQLNATASVPGTFAYAPAAGTLLTAGTQTLSTTFTPADTTDYASSSAAVSLVVTKVMPTITWPTPAPIGFGTPLSATQLNATVSVPGTLVYAPPAGTVLPAGTQTLSVAFTPTDVVDYTSVSAQVSLLVTQPLISISPGSINFGTVTRGTTASQTVTVSNPGNATLNFSGMSIKPGPGADSDDFKFKTNCGTSLAPGGSCSIVVTFFADDSGTPSATLVIKDNAIGSPQSVALTGTVGKKGH
jgi:hypothetical protein